MTLDAYRKNVKWIIDPVALIAIRIGLTPDLCTVLSLIAAGFAGIFFYFGYELSGIIAVAFNALFDALDGSIARIKKVEGKRGDFLDHSVDRYADIFIITGIFAGTLAPWPIGVFALTGVLMASYLGTQAQAVGVGRIYGGLLGRADRLVLLIIAGIIDLTLKPSLGGIGVMGVLLVIFGLLGHLTAIQRFIYVWKRIS